MLQLHRRWVEAAGGVVRDASGSGAGGVEVSPLLSYAGEGLEGIVAGRAFEGGLVPELQQALRTEPPVL